MLAALQCCHLIITISGLSVALLILAQTVLGALQGCHSVITTLLQTAASGDSLSLAPACPPGCSRGRLANDLEVEVDTCDESRGDS